MSDRYCRQYLFDICLLLYVQSLTPDDMIYDMMWYICKLQLGGHPVAVVQYTHTHTHTHNTQNKQYIEQHQNFGRVRAVPRLRGFYPGIFLTTEEKARINLSQGSMDGKTVRNM